MTRFSRIAAKGVPVEDGASLEDELSGLETSPSPADSRLEPESKQTTQELMTDKMAAARREGFLKKAGIALSFVIAALSLFVLARTLADVDMNALRGAIAATSAEQIAMAGLLTTLSFLALTGYDGLALKQLRLHVPYKTTALASFTSYAISFTLGFPLITGGTVRYWIYSQAGLTASKVASLTVIAGVTFWLGMALVMGIALTARAEAISTINHIDPALNRLIGLAVVITLAAYLVWVSMGQRHARFQGYRLELPGLGVTLGQMILGVIDICSAAGVLYVLMPAHLQLDFFTFAATYVFASVLGIASNAPGGIGVFEAAMLKAVPVSSETELLASLLLFRAIYYLVPFVLALAFIGAHEAFRRWKSLREAMIRENEKLEETE